MIERRRLLSAVLGWALALGAFGVLPVVAPAAVVASTKTTYRVPVTQPDELGKRVALEVDVYLPEAPAPPTGRPLLTIFHGGGSNKDNAFDAGHARAFADSGYAVILYSARGHGGSDGQTVVAGPKELRDLFDVLAWAFGTGGRTAPVHPDFALDEGRIALSGYSQGGLHTNLAQAHAGEPEINPYGFRFVALEPGNTPDHVFNALVENQALKLSFGVALLGTYYGGTNGRVSPIVDKWIATLAADQPQLTDGPLCDATGHDTVTSTVKQDLAFRSAGCSVEQMNVPSLWAQAFDDELFPADMAVSMWRRMPGGGNRLYLDMGGHAAPAAPDAVQQDKLRAQRAFLDHHALGLALDAPPVVYWTRDPAITVAADATRYPTRAWYRQSAPDWPPPDVAAVDYSLSADGRLERDEPASGETFLAPISPDAENDPVAKSMLSTTPLGTSPEPDAPAATGAPPLVAGFQTRPFPQDRELSGSPAAALEWTPASPDTQVVLKVFDKAPDGRLTLLSRGIQGIRGATPAARRTVRIDGHTFSARIRKGHRIVAWVAAGDSSFYKPYPLSAGGTLHTGPQSTLSIPLRKPG